MKHLKPEALFTRELNQTRIHPAYRRYREHNLQLYIVQVLRCDNDTAVGVNYKQSSVNIWFDWETSIDYTLCVVKEKKKDFGCTVRINIANCR